MIVGTEAASLEIQLTDGKVSLLGNTVSVSTSERTRCNIPDSDGIHIFVPNNANKFDFGTTTGNCYNILRVVGDVD